MHRIYVAPSGGRDRLDATSTEMRTYNTDGTLDIITAKNGTVTHHYYDYQDRLTKTETYSSSGELLKETSCIYNAFHLLSETDPEGNATHYSYDGAGRKIASRKGNSEMRFEYDTLGRLYKTIQHDVVTIQEYNLLNQVIEERVEDANGTMQKRMCYSYDLDGNRTEVITYGQAGEAITQTNYDFQGRPIEVIDAEGNTTITIYRYDYYNDRGQNIPCIEQTDALGNQSITIKDALNRVETVTRKNPFGEVIKHYHLFHDAVGNRTQRVETVYTPNADPREVITSWVYDTMGNLVTFIEAVGTPEQKTTHYRYNPFGQKEAVIKPDGTELLHTYDPLGRLKVFTASDNSFHYIYTYDKCDRPLNIYDPLHDTITTNRYDDYGNLIEEVLANGHKLSYRYDTLNRPLEITYPDGTGIQYSYEGLLMRNVSRIQADKTLYTHTYTRYDLAGNILESDLAKGAGKLICQSDKLGRRTLTRCDLREESNDAYDAVGNLTQRTLSDTQGEITYHYTYDDLYQITQEQTSYLAFNYQYESDSLFNRVKKGKKSYTLNALNQVLSDGVNHYTYDLNGNRISKGEIKYIYDALDRLVSVIDGSTKYCYTYDANNRRISKQEYQSSQLQDTIHYLYQGQNEVGALRKGNIHELRILGKGLGAEIGAAVAIELDHQVYVPVHDHNGNVRALINSHQAAETYRYSAFGEETLTTTLNNPWRFSSKRYDPETGFLYFGRRYYEPSLGKWVTADPMGYEAGPNLYAYVNNNPLTNLDLYGLLSLSFGSQGWSLDNSTYQTPQHQQGFYHSALGALGTVASTMGTISSTLGQGIELGAFHILPPCSNRYHYEGLGRLLQGKNYFHKPSWQRDSISGVIEGEKYPDAVHRYVNGIMTEPEGCIKWAQHLSEMSGGHEIAYTCHPSKGLVTDLLYCLVEKCGIQTGASKHLAEKLTEDYNTLSERSDNPTLYVDAHSRGGLEFNLATQLCDSQTCAAMNVMTFGSAKQMCKEGFKELANIVNEHDLIPRTDFVGYYFNREVDIHFTGFKSGNWIGIIDHFIDSPGYDDAARDRVLEIKNQHGATQ